MDDDLDVKSERLHELPLHLTFGWAKNALDTLALTLDDLGYFNASSQSAKMSDTIQQLRKEVLGK